MWHASDAEIEGGAPEPSPGVKKLARLAWSGPQAWSKLDGQ